MADVLSTIGDWLGLNKGNATVAAGNKNLGLLSGLEQAGQGYLSQAGQAIDPLYQLGLKGSGLYADALGLNGASGAANAQGAFTTQPGYEFSRDQGIRALMRTAAARGGLGGGGVGIGLANYVTQGANQQYGDWLSRLSGYNGILSDATGRKVANLGDQTQFAEDIASGRMNANNQIAGGQEAGQGKLWGLLGNVAGIGGAFAGFGKNGGLGGAGSVATGGGGLGGYSGGFGR